MFKKIVYLVVLIILSLCVIENVRVTILNKCVFPSMYTTAQRKMDYKALNRCGQIKFMAREYDTAQTIFLSVLRNASTSEYKKEKQNAFFHLANTYYETGDYDNALKAYAVVLKNEPGNRKALRKFARVKMAKEDYVSLYPFVAAYIKAKPNDSFGYTEGCALLTRLEKYPQARKFCEQALQIRRGNARAHYDYAVLLEKIGHKDLAADQYKEAFAQQSKIKSREELEAMLNVNKNPEE
ncbi:MAG: tetratricopeptide repeat protein [Fusobacterium sp.]|nr:tetratricopeptide repeat protein [Fusobacterium sp.]